MPFKDALNSYSVWGAIKGFKLRLIITVLQKITLAAESKG